MTPTPPTPYDTILRTRLQALLQLHGVSVGKAARAAGWAESTLHRRLNTDASDTNNYRRLHAGDVDQLLAALGLPPDAVDQPVLLPGDRDLLVWVGEHTPADPLPSRATLQGAAVAVPNYDRLVSRLADQGLLRVIDTTPDPDSWILRLTPAGQRALR